MRKPNGIFDLYRETTDQLSGEGALLIAGNPPNPMTIGWGTLGIIWGKPVFQVYVRPTRYTFGLMEKSTEFSVCFMPGSFSRELTLCGTKSGRDMDKPAACGFIMEPGILIGTAFIKQSAFHYECRIIHKHRLDAETLDPKIITRYYPTKDFHMVYYGEILGLYANDE